MLKRTIAPQEYPVSVDEAVRFARITDRSDDNLVESLIASATASAEQVTNSRFITQTWELKLDAFDDEIQLLQPLQSVTSISYVDPNGVTQTLATSVYTTDTVEGKVYTAYNQTWPAVRDIPNAITITFVVGYGKGVDVPESIKTWIRMRVATLYEQREALGDVKALPRDFVDGLLDPYKVY